MSDEQKPAPKKRASARTAERDQKVLELRRAGVGFDAIAAQLKFRDKAAAHAAYERALDASMPLPVDEARRLELERLDRLQTALWPKALRGDLGAFDRIVRLTQERMKVAEHGPLPQSQDRKPGPIEAATLLECDRLAKNAPALAAAAITLARCVDEAAAEPGAAATAARELRMTMSQLRGLAGINGGLGAPPAPEGEPTKGKPGAVVPESRLEDLRRRARERAAGA